MAVIWPNKMVLVLCIVIVFFLNICFSFEKYGENIHGSMLIINISLLGCWNFLFLLCLNLPLCLSLLWESAKVRQAAGAGIYSLNPVMDYTALVLSNFTHTTHWFGYCGLFWQYCGSAVGLTECCHFDRLIKPPMFLCLHTFKRDKSDLSRLAFSFVISHYKMPSGCGSFCSVLFHLTLTQLHLFTASHNPFPLKCPPVLLWDCSRGAAQNLFERPLCCWHGNVCLCEWRLPLHAWSEVSRCLMVQEDLARPLCHITKPVLKSWSQALLLTNFLSFPVHIVLLQVSTWLTWTRVLSIMSCCSNWKLKFIEL